MSWLSLETYAEERDSWTPSYRADIDRRAFGRTTRIRLSMGDEIDATWDPESRGWTSALTGDPVEDDVTHVWLGRRGGPSGPSGPSGSNLSEARRRELGYGSVKLRLPLDTLERLAELAHASGLSRAEEAAEIIDASWRAWKRKR